MGAICHVTPVLNDILDLCRYCNQLYRLRFAHQFLAQMLEAKVS